MSITSDASGLKLEGDEASPGNLQYYGTDGSGAKGFHALPSFGSAGDIDETSFSGSNDQSTLANVTGFAFDSLVVSGFSAIATVILVIDGVTTRETFNMEGSNQGADGFDMAIRSVGKDTQVSFDITSGGQVQYQSADYGVDFESLTIRFRAITTSLA